MNNKVILVVLDGLNYSVARDCMGYLNGLIEQQRATLYSLQCELPSLSRPLYECLLTGVKPVESGIVHNHIVRLSHHQSIFSLAKEQGLTTAAAAYHWVSELYNRTPFDATRDRFTCDKTLNIQHGCFYHWDHYPDEALFLDAEHLRRTHQPDFLLIHPMNIDDAGHKFGLDSGQYRNSARMADALLSHFLESWLNDGYQVMVTSDHGMNNDKSHGGILTEERNVPLFVLGDQFSHQACEIKQTELCGLCCQLLNLDHNKPFSAECLA
ncbi:nucleotide pyrophosphatase [Vibrio anguillarum]|uniref:alkaline phosphatase family protein n=1 Tax=Vibrio TaxID=662 RepID=UPI000B7BE95E|nr:MULTISPECIES: alkaline phosphatase family protein [Vibrio]ASO30481.1 nucleotide pyrophosphatase [Vibrio anguillarum]MDF9387304.1 alkaline phosphatase family protein [Vibrio sp. 1151_11]